MFCKIDFERFFGPENIFQCCIVCKLKKFGKHWHWCTLLKIQEIQDGGVSHIFVKIQGVHAFGTKFQNIFKALLHFSLFNIQVFGK
jgi:hypothetical protein